MNTIDLQKKGQSEKTHDQVVVKDYINKTSVLTVVEEMSPVSMDVLEKRIDFMANESIKSPRESRKKAIEKIVWKGQK